MRDVGPIRAGILSLCLFAASQYLAQCFKLSSHSIIKNLASKLINITYNKLINYLLINEWIFS